MEVLFMMHCAVHGHGETVSFITVYHRDISFTLVYCMVSSKWILFSGEELAMLPQSPRSGATTMEGARRGRPDESGAGCSLLEDCRLPNKFASISVHLLSSFTQNVDLGIVCNDTGTVHVYCQNVVYILGSVVCSSREP